MDIEFHYYVTYIFAQKAGFSKKDAYVIAYSSQYVDDNTIIFNINKGKANAYTNYISQTMDITKPKNRLMRIYPLFHFVPGDPLTKKARRRDGSLHLLNTTPGSTNGNKLINKALKTKNLYRIGIATHSFMDTWAHQNFIGYYDNFNSMEGLREKMTPNVGHADAMHQPDIPGLIWRDRRLAGSLRAVSNNSRFFNASEKVFEKYVKYHDRQAKKADIRNEWLKLRNAIEKAIGEEFTHDSDGRESRIKRYRAITAGIPEFKPDEWFKQAVETRTKGVTDKWAVVKLLPDEHVWKDGHEQSRWYNFQTAVIEHQHFAEETCGDIFNQMEIENY